MRNLLIIICLLSTYGISAQSLDDVGKIVIGFDVPETSSKETQELKEYINNKVSHWISQAGYSANGIASFCLYPDIVIDNESIAEGGMKNVFVISGTLYLKIVQSEGGVVFSSISLPFRASSTKKITAIKNGIGNLQFNRMLPLLDEAKDKILKYYESEKDNIIAQAELMMRQRDFDGAIAHLMSIPSCIKSVYQEALEKADEIFDYKIRVYNDSLLSVAKSFLAQHNAKLALDALVSYQYAKIDQNEEYQNLLEMAEDLLVAAEVEAAREKRQKYLDEKEREQRQWIVEDEERAHRMDLDNQQMDYNREALAANERITNEKINAIKSVAANYYNSKKK